MNLHELYPTQSLLSIECILVCQNFDSASGKLCQAMVQAALENLQDNLRISGLKVKKIRFIVWKTYRITDNLSGSKMMVSN